MDFENRKLILAPLAGITDTVFRRLCRRLGADIVLSEMVSAEGVVHRSKNTRGLTAFDQAERPIGIQLFGSDPDSLARAAAWVEEHARPDFIDLNAGCPVPKVVKKNGGAALLRDAKLFERIVKAMVDAVSLPVTVKLRSGWHMHEWVDVEYARIAEGCGAGAVTLHARSKTMGFSGQALWDRIAEVKSAVKIPVVGNGDIKSAQGAEAMFAQTGCDSVMIGRAALSNPWVFSEIRDHFGGRAHVPPTGAQRAEFILEHIRRYVDVFGEKRASAEMKKHVAWHIKGRSGVSQVRNKVFRARSSEELAEIALGYWGDGVPASAETPGARDAGMISAPIS